MDRREYIKYLGTLSLTSTTGCLGFLNLDNQFKKGEVTCTHKPYKPPDNTYPMYKPDNTYPMYKYDSQCTANPPESQAPTNFPLERKWKKSTEPHIMQTPICDKDTVYYNGSIAIRKNGEVKWRKDNKTLSIAVGKNLYKGNSIINKNTGEKISEYTQKHPGGFPIILGESSIYIGYKKGSYKNDIYVAAIDKNGKECWSYRVDEPSTEISGIAVSNGHITIITNVTSTHQPQGEGNNIFVLDKNGLKWKETFGTSDIAIVKNTLIVGSGQEIKAFNLDGFLREKWRIDKGQKEFNLENRRKKSKKDLNLVTYFPRFGMNTGGQNAVSKEKNTAYIVGKELKAVDIDTGDEIWTNSDKSESHNLTIAGDKIYYTTTDYYDEKNVSYGVIGALNADTGDKIFEKETDDKISRITPPSIAHNTLYFGTQKGDVYAFS